MPRFDGDVVDRAYGFGVRVLRMASRFPARAGFYRILDQITASATSIAANLEEAQAGRSRADFIHGVNIARKEARECWIRFRMLAEAELVPKARFNALIQECNELIALLTAIVRSTRSQGTRKRS